MMSTRPENIVFHGAAGSRLYRRVKEGQRAYPTQCTNRMVLDSQLPHKAVNFLLQQVKVNNKLTIL
jgi:hypothetical protein